MPGDIEVNPLREDRPPQPSEVPIHKNTQLYLTRNIRKKDDCVNGMLCRVEAWSATSGALRVRTKTNKRLYITPWTDVELGNVVYYPIRLGYASAVQKVLGAHYSVAGHPELAGGGLHSAEPRGEVQRVLLGRQAHSCSLRASGGEVKDRKGNANRRPKNERNCVTNKPVKG